MDAILCTELTSWLDLNLTWTWLDLSQNLMQISHFGCLKALELCLCFVSSLRAAVCVAPVLSFAVWQHREPQYPTERQCHTSLVYKLDDQVSHLLMKMRKCAAAFEKLFVAEKRFIHYLLWITKQRGNQTYFVGLGYLSVAAPLWKTIDDHDWRKHGCCGKAL